MLWISRLFGSWLSILFWENTFRSALPVHVAPFSFWSINYIWSCSCIGGFLKWRQRKVTLHNIDDEIRVNIWVHSLWVSILDAALYLSLQTPNISKCALTPNQTLSRPCNHAHKDTKEQLWSWNRGGGGVFTITEANKH